MDIYIYIYIYVSTWAEFTLTYDTLQIWTSYPITSHFSKHMSTYMKIITEQIGAYIYVYISTWDEFTLTCHDTFQIWTSYPITFHFSKHMRIHAHKIYNCIYRCNHVWTSFLCTNPSQQSCVSPIQQPISQAQIGPSTHIIQMSILSMFARYGKCRCHNTIDA